MKVTMELPDTPALSQLGEEHLRQTLVAALYHLGEYSEGEGERRGTAHRSREGERSGARPPLPLWGLTITHT